MTSSLFSSTILALTSQAIVIEALGWTLFHFVWQGAAVALALGGFLGFAGRLSPQIRYGAACAALLLMALAAGSIFVWYVASAERPVGDESAELVSADTSRPTIERESPAQEAPGAGNALTVREVAAIARPIRGEKAHAANTETAGHSTSIRIELGGALRRLFKGRTDRLGPWLTWLVGIWGVGVGLLALRLLYGWHSVGRLRTSARELVDPIWAARFTRLRERLGVSAPVRFLISTSATVPLVVGSLTPAILIPASLLTGLSTPQVEALLVHELVHIRRHDYFVNLMQNVLETLLFYHPLVWWVSGQIRKEREHCCDDVASSACGALDYAQALISLAEFRQASPGFGLAANSTPLVDRIRRLAGVEPSPQRTAGWLAVFALVVVMMAIALKPANHTHADGHETKIVKGTVIDAHGRPVAEAEVIAESHHRRCGSAQTNAQGEFRIPVLANMAIDTYSVSVPNWFDVSFALDQRAPLALSVHRFTARATIEKQEPLVLKVKSPAPWGGYMPLSNVGSSPQDRRSAQASRKITGCVVDDGGQPIAAARIWWMRIDHGLRRPTVLAECTSDIQGRFRMEVVSSGKALHAASANEQLWVLARGKQFQIAGEGEKLPIVEESTPPGKLRDIVIRLDTASDFVFQVNDSNGQPVQGATVERLWMGQYFPGALLGETPVEFAWPAAILERDRATTDRSGQVHLAANSDQLRIAAPEFGIQTIRLSNARRVNFPIGGAKPTVVQQLISARPVGRVEGQIVADETRLVRRIKLRLNTYWENGSEIVEGSALVTTDDLGRFVVPAIAAGNLRFRILDELADRSRIAIARPVEVLAEETNHVEIRLERAVVVQGTIQAASTGEPLAGAEIYLGGGFQQGEKLTSDGNGRYEARFPAGQVSLHAIGLPDNRHADYQQHYVGVRPGRTRTSFMQSPVLYKVAVKATVDGKPASVPALVRVPTRMLEGTVFDSLGRPILNATVKAQNGLGRYVGTTDARGEFEMQVPYAIKVESYDVWLPRRLVTNVEVQKREPLVLKVDSISETGGPEFSRPKETR